MKYLYSITCVANGKMYVGLTNNFKKRIYSHLIALRNNSHANYIIQEDYNLYGEKCFSFDLISEYGLGRDGDTAERYFISVLGINSENGNYNIDKYGNWESAKGNIKRSGYLNPFYGRTHSQETIIKIAKSKKGCVGARLGMPVSNGSRIKMSTSAKERGVDHLKKRIIDNNGVIYNSIKEYCVFNNLNYSNIKYYLQSGKNIGYTFL